MIVFMATGEKKANTLAEVLSDRYNPERYPAQRIDPKEGRLIWLVDESASQESRLVAEEQADNRHKALRDAMSVLNDRERRIFEARRLTDDPITLEELAEEFGVSRERVRQIEVPAFEKVQKAVKNRVAAMESPPTQPQLAMH